MTSTVTANPYLSGNFAPVRAEIQADNLKVIGELPPDLSGMFVRNGPNPQFDPIGQYHWFDGDGMLHGVRIHNGKASYINRYVRTRGFQLEQEAGRAIWTGIFEPPQTDHPYGPSKNTGNTALAWHAGQFLALWEGGEPHAITLPDLSTISPYTYNSQLTIPFTAHPKVDPITGEMRFFGYSLMQPPYLHYGVVSAAGELQKIVPIELPIGVMMHDFAITENYTIFMDLPLTFRPERMQQGEPAFMFENDGVSRFGIVPRDGDNSNIRWFETSPCYVFHTLNAYEAGDEVVLIGCRMTGTSVLTLEKPDESWDIPQLHCWRFNLKTGTVKEEQLDDVPSEFPRVNEQLTGQYTRYGYTAKAAPTPVPLFDGFIKYDFEQGSSKTHEFGAGRYGGEGVFVPHPNATTEDAGWLITFVYDQGRQQSELVVIDAQNITDTPIARVIIPHRVPYGFHGIWVSQAQFNYSA